jgi:Transport and Golgi organisation 2
VCTLILGVGSGTPGSVLIAANRDEDPARPSDPPRRLADEPPVAGGRDRRLGGTWLAVRGARAVVALLNRAPSPGGPPAGARSRGLLTLEVAGVRASLAGLPASARERALGILGAHPHAPFTLVFASPEGSWAIAHTGDRPPAVTTLAAGWHVVTHADLDDRAEPRTAWLLDRLAGVSIEGGALARAETLLRTHAGDEGPAVCIHDRPMATVSASSLWLARDAAIYRHAEGRPCEHAFEDVSDLLRTEVR